TLSPEELVDVLKGVDLQDDAVLAPYAMLTMASLAREHAAEIMPLMKKWSEVYATDRYVADALISGLRGQEENYLHQLEAQKTNTSTLLHRRLVAMVDDIQEKSKGQDHALLAKRYPKGTALFQT